VNGAPATNNPLETYYSTSLKTHRKKQLRTDRGIENQMKLPAMKRAGLLVEKNGIRAIECIMEIHRDTVSDAVEDLARHARAVTGQEANRGCEGHVHQ
jgi:hypothetical protein